MIIIEPNLFSMIIEPLLFSISIEPPNFFGMIIEGCSSRGGSISEFLVTGARHRVPQKLGFQLQIELAIFGVGISIRSSNLSLHQGSDLS